MIRKLERCIKKSLENFFHIEQESYPLMTTNYQVTGYSDIVTIRFTTLEDENYVVSIQRIS